MAGWFSRVIKGANRAEAEPVDFALTCRCGNIVTGVRGRRMQVVVCRKCGYQICVLPISPYPRPRIRAPKNKPAKPPPLPKRRNAVVDDDESPRTPPPLPRRGDRSVGSSPMKAATGKSGRLAERKVEPVRDDLQWQTSRRKLITPLRLISLGMIAVVALAGWWVVHQRAVAQAVLTFATATKAGQSALEKSEFETADEQYRRAVAALELLGRDDREARLVRQQARQIEAANGLALISLFELLSEARQVQKMAGNDWQRALKTSYQGKWFLLETNGLQFPSGQQPQWTFTLPLVPGDEPIHVSGDLSRWAQQLGTPKPTAHFVLAGQLADIRSLGSGNKGWEIVLDRDSICLWTDAALYSTLGGIVDDATRATLKSQAELLGVAE